MMDWLPELLVGVGLVMVGAFFAAIHEAFAAMTRGMAGKMVDEGLPGANRVAEIVADPSPTISTALFCQVVCEVGVVLMAGVVTLESAGQLSGWWLALAWGVAVVAIFTIIHVGARTLGQQHMSSITRRSSRLMKILTSLLYFIPQVMIWFGNAITPGRGFPDGPFTSEDELREYVDQAEASHEIEAGEKKMIYSVFELGDTLVREVMVPRTDLIYIEATKTLRQATNLALRSGFSRIPVVGPGGLADIVGIFFLKDAVRRTYDDPNAQETETVSMVCRPATWCPDSKPVDDLLKEMQADHSHLVVVADEFGGTAGIATIEDILEEIVGEIMDEYDTEPIPVTDLGDGAFRVSARMSLDDVGELVGKPLDDDDVESIGGIVAKILNKPPIPGASVTWEGLELIADQPTGRRHQIGTVIIKPLPTEQSALTNESTDD
jgi:CBS domain containing-hemolysin-like protein